MVLSTLTKELDRIVVRALRLWSQPKQKEPFLDGLSFYRGRNQEGAPNYAYYTKKETPTQQFTREELDQAKKSATHDRNKGKSPKCPHKPSLDLRMVGWMGERPRNSTTLNWTDQQTLGIPIIVAEIASFYTPLVPPQSREPKSKWPETRRKLDRKS